MKEALIKLLKVKSIITIVLTAVFAYLAIIGQIAPEKFFEMFLLIVSFYFGVQSAKKDDDKGGDGE